MEIEPIWGLQQLKKRLKGAEKEEFMRLESDLLDILHRQRLYKNNDVLDRERDEIFQKLEVLAQNSVHKGFSALSITTPATISTPKSSVHPLRAFSSPKEEKTLREISLLPKDEYTLLTKVVPIAYFYRYNEQEYPFITLRFDNTHKESVDSACNIQASIERYSDTARDYIEIPVGSKREVALLPVIGKGQMEGINEPCPATLHIEIEYLLPFSFHKSYTSRIQFLPRNVAILWEYGEDGSLVDYTSSLAAWVTPRHPKIENILYSATKYLPEKHFTGYSEILTGEKQPQKVREQVRAIFGALHREVQVTYISSSGSIQSQKDHSLQKRQRIRLPEEVINAGGSANCIDGSVLFASLLELANLQPLIFLRPGHAFVGWRVFKDEPVYEFLETTLIDKGDFDLALQQGQEQYEQALKDGTLGRPVNDLRGFACLIDIANCRREDIQPMAW